MKNNKITMELSVSEKMLIGELLYLVSENIQWDEEGEEYRENADNWILTLSPAEFNTLEGLRRKF